jgi:predicted nucleic acid-binding Zn ribbon protein
MSDEPGYPCPKCGAKAERRMSGGAGLVFKGSGFYITDYRGEGYKKAAESDKSASSGGESKPSESKSEPAAAPKSESKPSGSSSSGTSSGGTGKSE